MTKLLSFIIFSMLICFSVQAEEKVYSRDKTKKCAKDETLLCDLNENLLNGIFKFDGDFTSFETPYKNGEKDGVEKVYRKDGTLLSETPYKNGKIEGLVKWYREDGTLKRENPYKNGEEDGVEIFYDLRGRILHKNVYSNGVPADGVQKWYYSDGTLLYETPYKNGEKDGVEKYYREDGTLAGETPYKNGKINGTYRRYYKNGKIKEEISYKNDRQDGARKSYYKNGKLSNIEYFKNFEPYGVWETYDINGILGHQYYYNKGRLEWKKDYDIDGKLESKTTYVYQNESDRIELEQKHLLFYKNGNLLAEYTTKDGSYIREGLTILYDKVGNKIEEIMFKGGEPLYGYLYDSSGRKKEMTNAHLYNRTNIDDDAFEKGMKEANFRFPNDFYED